ncbi:Protein DCAR-1 [Aphelenchoides avenae]|nr:Protein DCAR-1 [Aphelenchus avenae]
MSMNYITRCWPNVTTVDDYNAIMAKQQVKLNRVFKIYHAWLALPPAVIGFAFSILFCLAILRAIKQRRVSRKCYILILNRSIGDIFACIITFIIIGYTLAVHDVSRLFHQVIDVFFIGCFWTGMVSYVSLSLMKLYAIWRPLSYRDKVTIDRIIQVAVLSWVIFVLYLVYSMLSVAFVKTEYLRELTGCKIETCQRVMYKIRNIVGVADYAFTVACFLITVVLVHKAHKFASSFHRKSENDTKKPRTLVNRFPMWKIALNVATFAVFHSFYMIWSAFLLYNRDPCLYQKNFVIMSKILGVVRFSLLCRIVMDPVLSFITDFQARESLSLQLLKLDVADSAISARNRRSLWHPAPVQLETKGLRQLDQRRKHTRHGRRNHFA